MSRTPTDQHTALDLSRPEAWVVHAALLDRIERESDDDADVKREVSLLRGVEHDDLSLDSTDRDILREALSTYLSDAPGRDRVPGQTVLDELGATLA